MTNIIDSRITSLMRPDLLEFEEYVAVEPLEKLSQRLGLPIEKIVKLNANENPYGASPAALEALRNAAFYHHYPDPTALFLREELEKYIGVPREQILIGSGADELIELVVKLFIQPGDNIIDLVPTFGMYAFFGQLYQAEVREVPRHLADYSIDLEATLAAVDARTKLIFVCTPNNPTANPCSEEVIRRLLQTGKIVVVDEAYHDFSGHNFLNLTNEYENLIVLRTFSKLSGLAGLRVGYGIFPPEVVRQLWKIKQPYNVTVAGQAAARASLQERTWIEDKVKLIINERERLFGLLQTVAGVEPLPSASNFIFCRVHKGQARAVAQALETKGIFIRYYNKSYLTNSFRISVGTPAQTDLLMVALREVMQTVA